MSSLASHPILCMASHLLSSLSMRGSMSVMIFGTFPMQIKLISTGSELSLMLQMRSTCMSKRPALVMRNLSSVFLFFSL